MTRTEDVHELATVERLLRADDRCFNVSVRADDSGARIGFDSYPHNSHARGSLTATVVNELAATESWGLSTLHDPLTREEDDTGAEVVGSMMTLVYRPDE